MLIKTELLWPLAIFCAASLFTPGPNNFMLMTSGLNFGIRKTMPHMLGVALGFPFLVLSVGIGLGGVFTAIPMLYPILKYAGAAYMLYLAWAIATSNPHAPHASQRKNPLTFIEAATFQWINPKAWIMAIGSVSTYGAVATYPWNILIIVVFFLILGLGSCSSWTVFGHGLQHLLANPKKVRVFNIAMGLLLAVSIIPVLME